MISEGRLQRCYQAVRYILFNKIISHDCKLTTHAIKAMNVKIAVASSIGKVHFLDDLYLKPLLSKDIFA